ncbi:hypothetical protein B0H10DRAFT_1939979 [Mycena sp. CBHHK59/15]|nr:hypothetical protein B0H10DRAFT_1939979 [Mycena sp. CBHHK59/15]
MPDPPKTPPPFHPRAPPSPSTPYHFNPVLAKAIPTGNYLILRGVYVANSKVIEPVAITTAKVAEIRTINASIRDIPLDISPISARNTSTSCYARLHPCLDPIDPSAEPRTDLLQLWINALGNTGWEELLQERAKEKPTQEEREREDKVIASTRKAFDDAGFETVGGFKSGLAVTIILALPHHVDSVIAQASIKFASSFERNGQSLLLEARVPRGESKYLILAMVDWEATHRVLTATDRFLKDLGHYSVSVPQLLYALNTSSAWRHNPATKGAEKLAGSFATLTCRIESNELTNITAIVSRYQEDLTRGLFQLQQEMQLASSLGLIDSTILMSRHAIAHPADDEEREEAQAELKGLKAQKEELMKQLNVVKGVSIASAGPAIPPPAPLLLSTSTLNPPLPLLIMPSSPAARTAPTTPTSPPGITCPTPTPTLSRPWLQNVSTVQPAPTLLKYPTRSSHLRKTLPCMMRYAPHPSFPVAV